MSRYILYRLTNTANGKVYIGVSRRSIKARWRQHVNDSNAGSQYAIHRAIRKYGSGSFDIDVLASANDHESILLMEVSSISLYDSMNPAKGYNMTPGGRGVTSFRAESIEKLAASQRKRSASLSAPSIELMKARRSASEQGLLKSGGPFVGVRPSRNKISGSIQSFQCEITFRKKRYRRCYMTEVEAATAYDTMAIILYGKDAKINFPDNRETYLSVDRDSFLLSFHNDRPKMGRRPKHNETPRTSSPDRGNQVAPVTVP